ncbi:MAG: aminomethyl-transferring glycine dehydrogenase subunit GcvPB [Candidatus Marinimicrobia bacterium]|nr:aminomethyl-transferring glycine dehydrogenase subunit GcvPB [Candidatus Neomarinimicrobiota bacterium]MCF7828081.1 aminomethyl-transferring glycine dehydrogenase subunit GcvPB [Candidatus Neomarinimicrobiota bacterium]MCF7879744.1 aminomethyl-transferring glycine dehydrogenase subunit GcvPB [Candidatus Neomarinimicrobiota bacterium]
MSTSLLNELSTPGKQGCTLPECDVPKQELSNLIPEEYLRDKPAELPEVSEPELVRHFTNLSAKNYHVDKNMYPLGSCTMKYNPKINDAIASLPGFAEVHPEQPVETLQGVLQLYYELEQLLCSITGMHSFTLQPAAGSHGELTGVMIMRKYHEMRGNKRKHIIIPDSAHGTNPASVAMGGFEALEVQSNDRGMVDVNDLRNIITDDVAGMMLTNPNTLGLFEEDIREITDVLHEVDALMYMDGANMNALLGIARPADMGFDITHLNLHKTFSTPHGGGGPGSGPIGVTEELAKFLPKPIITYDEEQDWYDFDWDLPESIGKIHGFYGNYGMMVRAYTYIRMLGAQGLKELSKNAIINANYLKEQLNETFDVAYPQHCMHEFVLSGTRQKKRGANTMDMAKRLLDYGFHAPTVYFPLIVKEALMIEPTESETRETLDNFASVLKQIDQEIDENPELVHDAPHTTPLRRLDEVTANREPNLRW